MRTALLWLLLPLLVISSASCKRRGQKAEVPKDYNKALEDAQKACNALCDAQNNTKLAKQKYDQLVANKAPAQQIADAKQDWDTAQAIEDAKRADYQAAARTLSDAAKKRPEDETIQ